MSIVADGATVNVYRCVDGQAMALICSTTGATGVLTTAQSRIDFAENSNFRIDNYELVSNNSSGTVTYAYDTANQMTSMTDISGAIAFTYDDWGRTISKSRGGLGAAYAYKYGSNLNAVTSTMYDEGNVTYGYRADGKRHTRQVGAGAVTTYNWDGAWDVVSEQTGSTLTRTYIGDLVHVDGATPASGAYIYYMHDNLGSTRVLFNQSKAITAEFEYDPYGGAYGNPGPSHVTHRYTGHAWDSTSGLYYAQGRDYSVSQARCLATYKGKTLGPPDLREFFGDRTPGTIRYELANPKPRGDGDETPDPSDMTKYCRKKTPSGDGPADCQDCCSGLLWHVGGARARQKLITCCCKGCKEATSGSEGFRVALSCVTGVKIPKPPDEAE